MLSPEQLLAAETESDSDFLDGLIATLSGLGFGVTAWQPGSKGRTLVQAFAKHAAGTGRIAPKLLRTVLLGLSRGDSLDLIGYYMYGGQEDARWLRYEARAAERTVTYSVAVSASPISVAPGSLVGTASGVTFATTNTAPVAVAAGETSAPITVRARTPGTSGNVADGVVDRSLTSYGGTTIGDDTLTLPGVARESDDAYTSRLLGRFALLTYAVGYRAYELWAREADQAITRVYVRDDNPGGPNTIYVYVANDDGPATVGQVAAVQAAISRRDRRAINDIPTAFAATSTSRTITASPVMPIGGASAATIKEALRSFAATLPIGGERIPAGSTPGKLYRDSLIGILFGLGVKHPGLTLPAADSVIPDSAIINPSVTVTPTYV